MRHKTFKNILKPILYHFLNISLTTSPCLKILTSKKFFFQLVLMEYCIIWKSVKVQLCKNSQFAQHIMHKNEAHEFSTQGQLNYTYCCSTFITFTIASAILNAPYIFHCKNDTHRYSTLKVRRVLPNQMS